ncbi:MAG: hypothetical protein AAB544_06040 [Patescibacteria group bacterium]
MKHSSRAVRISALCAAVLTLVACKASLTGSALKTRAEAHIRANISEISTRSPVLGGKFTVTKIEWVDDDTARIYYEDGHIALNGTADISLKDDVVVISKFRIVNDKDDQDEEEGDDKDDEDEDEDSESSDESSRSGASQSSLKSGASAMSSSNKSSGASTSSTSSSLSSSASVSSRAGAGLGEFCGGIAGIMCDSSLTCDYDGTYPDAGGTCVES